MVRAGHEFEVSFHGQLSRVEAERLEQVGHGGAGRQIARLAVDENLHDEVPERLQAFHSSRTKASRNEPLATFRKVPICGAPAALSVEL